MAQQGQVPCGKCDHDGFADVLIMHAGTETDISRWWKYNQLKPRRKPEWSEMWRTRAVLRDCLESSRGYQLKQKDVESCVEKALKDRKVDGSADDIEDCGYRIRAMMMHARNTTNRMWSLPAKYAKLQACVDLARTDPPPSSLAANAVDTDGEGGSDDILTMAELQAIDDGPIFDFDDDDDAKAADDGDDVEFVKDSRSLSFDDLDKCCKAF